MRWENLSVERQEGETSNLPGFRDPAKVRRFDAPEAMGIRFHEISARSAINEVPKASRMPFRYTINPYRGCAHRCTYCAAGDTPIMMADGRTRPLEEIRAGDRIYGTAREGSYRRYVVTEVLDHWTTKKQAYRVTLENGTELVASGDHRFLTNRGWKHVTDAPGQRSHLTRNNKLMGFGALPDSPAEFAQEYRRGYLCGLIRGDGTLGSYEYRRPNGRPAHHHRFRLALTDFEALRRAQRFLADFDVPTDEFGYAVAGGFGARRETRAIRTQARASVGRIAETISYPRRCGKVWCAGFLAGIFDAEGSFCGGGRALRICNSDPEIIDWIVWSMRELDFDFVMEGPRGPSDVNVIRLLGGLREQLRFFHSTNPSITRKRTFEGTALKSDAKLKVVSIEPLPGKRLLYDITTGTGDFIANGVVSHNCFARPTHTYLDFNAREDFEREIVVKVNAPELLRNELAKRSWGGDHVALGTNTDPYQWVEGRYRLMRGIWAAMRDYANPCSVLTKSPLLTRDIDLMLEIAERAEFTAALSIPTLEEKAWRATEPGTPHPRKRIEAVAKLTAAGIPTGVLVAPLQPGINDHPEQVRELVDLCVEAGATHVTPIPLHLRGEVKEIWFDWLERNHPELLARYRELYGRGAYMAKEESQRLTGLVKPRVAPEAAARRPRWRGRRAGARAREPERDEPSAEQPALF